MKNNYFDFSTKLKPAIIDNIFIYEYNILQKNTMYSRRSKCQKQ